MKCSSQISSCSYYTTLIIMNVFILHIKSVTLLSKSLCVPMEDKIKETRKPESERIVKPVRDRPTKFKDPKMLSIMPDRTKRFAAEFTDLNM